MAAISRRKHDEPVPSAEPEPPVAPLRSHLVLGLLVVVILALILAVASWKLRNASPVLPGHDFPHTAP